MIYDKVQSLRIIQPPLQQSNFSGGSIRMEVSNPEASAKNGELVLCNINMDSSGGDI